MSWRRREAVNETTMAAIMAGKISCDCLKDHRNCRPFILKRVNVRMSLKAGKFSLIGDPFFVYIIRRKTWNYQSIVLILYHLV